MEQIYKRNIPSRSANQLTEIQCNIFANSNAVSSASGDFARLTKEVKKLLGIAKQKTLYC